MSKRIFFALIFFIVLVGGVFIFTKTDLKFPNLNKNENKYNAVSAVPQNPKLYVDTDNDGLKDWEEELWKTDLNNPDTDGDKTSDFDEIRAGRNPLVPGPNDLLPEDEIISKVNKTIESDLTETDKFARLFFAQYTATKNGEDYEGPDYEKLLSLLDKPVSENLNFVGNADLKIVPATEQNVKNYGNQIAKIINTAKEKYPASEIEVVEKAVKQYGNNFAVDKIKEASERYNYLASEFQKIEVPIDLSDLHTEIINVLKIIADSVLAMEFYFTDPVSVATQISAYPDSIEILDNSFNEMIIYFREKNIKFSTAEDGFIFFGRL